MSVGIVIVTHGGIGDSLVRAAEFILGHPLEEIGRIAVTQSGSEMPDTESFSAVIAAVDQGDGVLVLSDLACASPSNTIEKLLAGKHARVVSGINLAMLLRA